jgi:ribulose-phosphate 3-epimerase
MHDVIPGILEKDWQEVAKKLEIVRSFSKSIHIDFLDGKFSPETSLMDFTNFQNYSKDLFLEAHLMVENPTQYVKPLASAGFKRFLGHIEKIQELDEFVAEGQIFGEVGLALDSQTSIDAITISLDDLDVILLMSVKAGKSGQEFLPQVLEKIKAVREKSQIPIEVDGGINEETIVNAKAVGANRFVATSCIFNSQNPMQEYQKLTSLI